MKATKEQLLNFLCEQLNDCGITDWFGYNQSIESFRLEMSKKKQWELQSIVFDLNEEGQKFIESFENPLHAEFKEMKRELNLTNSDIADITGLTVDSVKTMTQPNRELPAWAKSMIFVWQKLK